MIEAKCNDLINAAFIAERRRRAALAVFWPLHSEGLLSLGKDFLHAETV